MTTLADRTIGALRAVHDDLARVVPGLSEEQLAGPSGAAEWTVAQVLSHLGSGAEIARAGLKATLTGGAAPAPGFNHEVWDRWNAKGPKEQAFDFLDADDRLVATYEAVPGEQREQRHVDLRFLPGLARRLGETGAPLRLASVAGMRLNEAAQHAWDVQVALDPAAALSPEAAELLAEHLAGGLSFLTGFIGKPGVLAEPAVVAIEGTRFGVAITDRVALVSPAEGATATFAGPLESAIRLVGGRLGAEHTPAGVAVTGAVTLDDLRRVFPGY